MFICLGLSLVLFFTQVMYLELVDEVEPNVYCLGTIILNGVSYYIKIKLFDYLKNEVNKIK